MRILFLAQRIPYPPNRGDKILSWRVIERLQRRHEVTVIAFQHDPADALAAESLREKGFVTIGVPYDDRRAKALALPYLLWRTPLTLRVYGSRQLQREVDRRAPACDLLYAFSSSMGAFILPYADKPRIMHFADLDSDKWRQVAKREPLWTRWIYRREAHTLLEFERQLAHGCQENIFCTPLEEKVFQDAIDGARSTVIENGVDLEYYRPVPASPESADLVFVGVMNYLPNIDACVTFAKTVFPRIREHNPRARFVIVGSHPTAEVLALAKSPQIVVTGFVDDTRTYIAEAAVSVAPLRIARGVQNKVLEAMAMGKCVVLSPSAAQGIAATSGEHYWVAENEDEEVKAIVELLGNPARRAAFGARARAYVEAHHDWELNFARLDSIVEEARQRFDGHFGHTVLEGVAQPKVDPRKVAAAGEQEQRLRAQVDGTTRCETKFNGRRWTKRRGET